MIRRTSVALVLVLLAGCNRGREESNAPPDSIGAPATMNTQQITLFVDGMTGRQGIT